MNDDTIVGYQISFLNEKRNWYVKFLDTLVITNDKSKSNLISRLMELASHHAFLGSTELTGLIDEWIEKMSKSKSHKDALEAAIAFLKLAPGFAVKEYNEVLRHLDTITGFQTNPYQASFPALNEIIETLKKEAKTL